MSVRATNLGFPRIGVNRDLKKALENYWKGQSSREALIECGAKLRERHWKLQSAAGLDHIPSNDFSFYDQILDLSCMLGCVPQRYGWQGGEIDLDTYFAMARGRQSGAADVTAMEMSKWFDTNYHFLVPEFEAEQTFRLSSTKVFDEYAEAKRLGIETRPVLVGPLTYVTIGKKRAGANYCRSTLIAKVVPVYIEVLKKLQSMGAQWVQLDEPALVLDLRPQYSEACKEAYRNIAAAAPCISICAADLTRQIPTRTIQIASWKMLYREPATNVCRWVSSTGAISGRTICARRLRGSKRLWLALARIRSWLRPVARSCTRLSISMRKPNWMRQSVIGWHSRPKNCLKWPRLREVRVRAVKRFERL
jgi:methionine synthase II (cobalamin-independent)